MRLLPGTPSRKYPQYWYLTNYRLTTHRLLIGVLCISLGAAATTRAAGIYECTNANGQRIFTHHDCPRSHPERDLYNPELASIYTSPALSAEERNTLAGIDGRGENRGRGSRQTAQAATLKDCAATQRELRAIRAQKRKGYALADARRLDAQEARLKQERNGACY